MHNKAGIVAPFTIDGETAEDGGAANPFLDGLLDESDDEGEEGEEEDEDDAAQPYSRQSRRRRRRRERLAAGGEVVHAHRHLEE